MKTRKIISTLLALCMLLSLFPTVAFAEDENEPELADEQLVNEVMPDGEAQESPDPSSGEPQGESEAPEDTTQTEAESNEDELSFALQSVSAAQMQTVSENRSNSSMILSTNNATEVSSGECGAQGNNLTWTLYDNGELVISGTGDMADYQALGTPWGKHRTSITSVTIEEGVTSVVTYAFSLCSALTSVTIPNSVTSISDGAFRGCSALTSVAIPSSVTSINDGAFLGCSALTSVAIPSSVTSIGGSAFQGCSALTSVTIPNSVTSIGNSAFRGCSALTSVAIPSSVTSIGNSAFSGCSLLTSIAIPASVTSVREGAFSDSGIESITVVEGNRKYRAENSALIDRETDTLLTVAPAITGDYVIPMGVRSIGVSAFQNYKALTSVTISASVMSIGNQAFYDCGALTSVTISASMKNIGGSAFSYCDKLTDIYYNGTEERWSAINIADDNECLTKATIHFTGVRQIVGSGSCGAQGDNLAWTLYDDGELVISGAGDMADYQSAGSPWYKYCAIITSVTISEGVTSIGDRAFSGCYALTTAEIPQGVTSIGDDAFNSCIALTSVTIPSSVTNIGYEAFYYCVALTSVTIPAGVTSIGERTFCYCRGLTSVTIPSSVTSIGNDAFRECSALTSVVIPEGVTSIGHSTFYWCSALESVTIPANVTSIGDWAFGLCSALTSVTIPAGVTSIGESAFSGCSALTSIAIPASVTSVGIGAFAWSGIESITVAEGNVKFRVENNALIDRGTDAILIVAPAITGSYTIPESVTSIGYYGFDGCKALTSVTIPSNVTSIGEGAFSGCSALESVTIPASVTSIGGSAFSWCSALTSLTIPAGVTSIGDRTFQGCSELTSVTIPASVTSIGAGAFQYCDKLTDVYYGGTEEQWAAVEIGEVNDPLLNATIHFTNPPAEPLKIVINSASVVFDGLIRLKYYFTLPDVLLDASDSYLVFYKNDQELKRTALKNGKPVNQSGDPSNKSFDLSVVAKEFNDEIVIKLLDKDGGAYTLVTGGGTDYTESGFPYSVRKYADYLKDNSGKAKMRALAKALGEYGDAASVYFGGAGTVSDDVKAVTLDDFNDYAVKMDGVTPAGITGKSMSVMFEADNSLRIYLSFASGYSPEKYSFTVDGNPATMQENANHEFYLTAKNIAAKDLEAYHTFTISDGKDTYTIQASVLSYARILVSGNKPNSQNLGKALYLYNRAADAYFAN